MSKWRTIDDLEVPEGPGVYAIYFSNEVVYVGSSRDVRHRLYNHGINWCRYSSWIMTPWGHQRSLRIKVRKSDVYGDWAMHELRLIRRLKPRFNSIGKKDSTDAA